MARVYLAYDFKHQRLVALKVLEVALADVVTGDRFLEEIRILAGLQHPTIVPLYDSGYWNGLPFFVMPYVDGESLRTRIAREQRMPLADVVRIVGEVGEALARIHRAGYVHRDVKPENVLISGSHAQLADFGIATALRHALSDDRDASRDMVLGTPSYMAPEQFAGLEPDARSDIFSLGCLTYEMLVGRPPFGNAGLATEEAFVPTNVGTVRADVSPRLDAVLRRALAADPEARQASAGQFLDELRNASQGADGRRLRSAGITIMVTLAIVLGGILQVKPWRAPVTLDPNAYAVFPFRHGPGVTTGWLDGEGCARLLYDAMARWRGVRLVNDMMASDMFQRAQPRTVRDVLAAAESLHAGHVTWGEVVNLGDSLEFRATTYDVAGGARSARQFVVRSATDMASLRHAFNALADSVVVGGQLGEQADVLASTRDVRAVRAYVEGRAAMDRFDLPAARARFGEAVAADAGFAHGFLWLVRAMSWSGADAPTWTGPASRAVALSTSLPLADRMHASALLALAEHRQDVACATYRRLITRDSTDFAAWIGLGDCNATDRRVLRDPRSPSGYRFRGSYHQAVRAYERALALVPSLRQADRGSIYQRLVGRVLVLDEASIRRGFALEKDTLWFGARASLAADTLAQTPYPFRNIVTDGPGARPRTLAAAVAWGRQRSVQHANDWVRAFPTSAEAHEALGLGLEQIGRLTADPTGMGASALSELRRAAQLSRDPEIRRRVAVAAVRVRLKAGEWSRAASEADSILRTTPPSTGIAADELATLALLTGRAVTAAQLLRRATADTLSATLHTTSGRVIRPNGSLVPDATVLLGFAALGAPADSIRRLYASVEREVRIWADPGDRREVRSALLTRPAWLAWEVVPRGGVADLDGQVNPVLGVRQRFAAGDTAAGIAELRRFEQSLEQRSPGVAGIALALHLGQIHLDLRDTVGAVRALDRGLDNLPRARPVLLGAFIEAGSIVRAMMLRADVALALGDRDTARRWADAAATLFAQADPELRTRAIEIQRRATR